MSQSAERKPMPSNAATKARHDDAAERVSALDELMNAIDTELDEIERLQGRRA